MSNSAKDVKLMNYDEFVDSKRIEVAPSGFDPGALNPKLFDYQRDITRWAIRRGKAALFEDCGLGKSFQEWEWGHHVANQTGKPVLIFAPLSVGEQMIDEAPDFRYSINWCDSGVDLKSGLNVTNYEKLHKFSPDVLGGIILDESSILKGGSFGKTATDLVEFADKILYRLAATATPAPNDLFEIAFHSEFLGIMREAEVKALFFTQEKNSSNKFRLKRNAVEKFYKWLASWAVAIRKPSDLGYSDEGFQLPRLDIEQIIVDANEPFANGTLFPMEAKGISEQRKVRKNSVELRVDAVASVVNASNEQWLVWCDLNPESELLAKKISDSTEVSGKSKTVQKIDAMRGFKSGKYRNVISKPSMWGFGMNFQHSHNAALCGLGNSFERYYQLIKRQQRFGQLSPVVNIKVFVSSADGAVVENIKRKWRQNDEMFDNLVKHMAIHADLGQQTRHEMEYEPTQNVTVPAWMNNPVKTKTQPGMTWINMDAILYKFDGVVQNIWEQYKDLSPTTSMIIPQWIETVGEMSYE